MKEKKNFSLWESIPKSGWLTPGKEEKTPEIFLLKILIRP